METKERPILFKGEMVRAILEGRKTQTRRVGLNRYKNVIPGDKLWVRETFANMCKLADPYCSCETEEHHYIEYRADTENKYPGCWDDADKEEQKADYVPRWKPSIFMPRSASRITLEVIDCRIERLQDISHEDAIAEGVSIESPLNNYGTGSIPRDAFAELWDSINKKRGYGWNKNPLVCVIEFRRLELS